MLKAPEFNGVRLFFPDDKLYPDYKSAPGGFEGKPYRIGGLGYAKITGERDWRNSPYLNDDASIAVIDGNLTKGASNYFMTMGLSELEIGLLIPSHADFEVVKVKILLPGNYTLTSRLISCDAACFEYGREVHEKDSYFNGYEYEIGGIKGKVRYLVQADPDILGSLRFVFSFSSKLPPTNR